MLYQKCTFVKLSVCTLLLLYRVTHLIKIFINYTYLLYLQVGKFHSVMHLVLPGIPQQVDVEQSLSKSTRSLGKLYSYIA